MCRRGTIRTREGAEIGVEGAVLLHDDDHMLDRHLRCGERLRASRFPSRKYGCADKQKRKETRESRRPGVLECGHQVAFVMDECVMDE